MASKTLPPIQDGEIYIRCPKCDLIGWTIDDDDQPMPICSECEVEGVKLGKSDKGHPLVVLIDGPPTDPAHHLGGK